MNTSLLMAGLLQLGMGGAVVRFGLWGRNRAWSLVPATVSVEDRDRVAGTYRRGAGAALVCGVVLALSGVVGVALSIHSG